MNNPKSYNIHVRLQAPDINYIVSIDNFNELIQR